jgi:hypothetical protein
MDKTLLFDLEKIKEITNPIEELQGKLNNLEEDYNKFIFLNKEISLELTNRLVIDDLKTVLQILENVMPQLIKISNENINKFLVLQDHLIKEFKDSFKNHLKELKLSQEFSKHIGLALIETKKINKIISNSSFVNAITLNQWLDLLDSLKLNSLFIKIIKKASDYYNLLIEKKLEIELEKLPKDMDITLIDDYKKKFKKNTSLTFKQFLQEIENRYNEEELVAKKQIIEKAKEKEQLEELKKKQEAQQQSYEEYLKFSRTEFERMRRKKKREKLSDVITKSKNDEKLKISDEISQKIEKFKSKFDDSFEEKYMIQESDERNPLDLIRERKKEKKKELDKFLKKFEHKEE